MGLKGEPIATEKKKRSGHVFAKLYVVVINMTVVINYLDVLIQQKYSELFQHPPADVSDLLHNISTKAAEARCNSFISWN